MDGYYSTICVLLEESIVSNSDIVFFPPFFPSDVKVKVNGVHCEVKSMSHRYV